jgi:hypothetical protein
MLKKFAALTCASLVSTVLVFGLSGCSDNKPAAAPAGGGATPAAGDHATPGDKPAETK